jgi:hypothetical protein
MSTEEKITELKKKIIQKLDELPDKITIRLPPGVPKLTGDEVIAILVERFSEPSQTR